VLRLHGLLRVLLHVSREINDRERGGSESVL
jgi:hypothetical protein